MKHKHVEWFQLGARTLRAVARERGVEEAIPTDEDWYVCPLCLCGLTIDELDRKELTAEHVPPEALGGAELVLTCRDCNNFAGSWFDAEAHKEQQLRDFFSGHSGQAQYAKLTVGDTSTRVKAHFLGQGGIYMVSGGRKINNPADLEAQEAHMRKLSATRTPNVRFNLTIRLRYHPDRSRVSWIRTGYLAAFALFGWKYILQPALEPIREQFLNRSDITLPPLHSFDPNGDPNRRQIWSIEQPIEHRSLLVISGQHGIFLPLPDDPRSIDQLSRDLGAYSNERVEHHFTGTVFPWPSGPEHLLDPAPLTT